MTKPTAPNAKQAEEEGVGARRLAQPQPDTGAEDEPEGDRARVEQHRDEQRGPVGVDEGSNLRRCRDRPREPPHLRDDSSGRPEHDAHDARPAGELGRAPVDRRRHPVHLRIRGRPDAFDLGSGCRLPRGNGAVIPAGLQSARHGDRGRAATDRATAPRVARAPAADPARAGDDVNEAPGVASRRACRRRGWAGPWPCRRTLARAVRSAGEPGLHDHPSRPSTSIRSRRTRIAE